MLFSKQVIKRCFILPPHLVHNWHIQSWRRSMWLRRRTCMLNGHYITMCSRTKSVFSIRLSTAACASVLAVQYSTGQVTTVVVRSAGFWRWRAWQFHGGKIPSVKLSAIMQASLDKHLSNRHHFPVVRWMEISSGSQFLNSSLADDHTIQQLGIDLSKCYWALLNRFWTNQGHSASCQKKWGLAATDMCPCGKQQCHIVNSCTQTKLEDGLQRLYSADDIATEWLKTYGS